MNNKLGCFITVFTLIASLSLSICAMPSLSDDDDSISESSISAEILEVENDASWAGNTLEYFSAGLGTEDFPYIIKSADELALLSKVVNEKKEGFYDAFYLLGSDIDLGAKEWTPIGTSADAPFKGTLDGGGYSISNFKLSEREYVGLFGYILNGNVKNLAVTDFDIDHSFTSAPSYSSMYVGAVAGYICSTNGESNVSAVCVSDGTINFNGKVDNLYLGSIVGYANSYSSGEVNIFDCFADSNITAINSTGFNFIGGLAGQLTTGTTSLTNILHCYSTGSVSSTADHTSRAGGLVGYLYSSGNAYAQPGSASLLATDKDIMLKDSFSVASVYSLSTSFTSRAGYLTGECNTNAGVKNVFRASSGVVVTADKNDGTLQTITETTGTAIAASNFKNKTYLSGSRGFDFVNVWGISAEINDGYPYLLCTTSQKAEIKSVDINIGAKSAEGNVRYFESDGFQYPLYERADNLIKIVPKKDLLIEIVEKESADSLYTLSTKYYFVDYETMTYREISKLNSFMDNNNHATIRTKDPISTRFTSKISTKAKREETDFVIEEYGFIIGAKSLIEKTDSQLNFDFEKYSSGVSYNRTSGTDLIFDSTDDDLCVFTGILVNVPISHYDTVVTSKNYAKITIEENEFIIYGEPVSASLYDVAKEQIASLDENDPKKAALQQIIDIVEAE